VSGISLDGGIFNLFIDSMTQFNNKTHEFTAIRRPPSSASNIPSLNELAMQQNWEKHLQEVQPSLPQAPEIDLLDAPDAPPVLMAQTSESSEDDGMALFATLLTSDDPLASLAAQRSECRYCPYDALLHTCLLVLMTT
jgi:hypothetical protein